MIKRVMIRHTIIQMDTTWIQLVVLTCPGSSAEVSQSVPERPHGESPGNGQRAIPEEIRWPRSIDLRQVNKPDSRDLDLG